MIELDEEIKQTLNLMQTDIDDGAHSELQYHLHKLLESKRSNLQKTLPVGYWIDDTHAQEPNEIVLTDLKKAFGCYSRPNATEEPNKRVKPLTADELRSGGWWCSDVSDECRRSLIMNGMEPLSPSWNDGRDFSSCCLHETLVVRINTTSSTCKQIHRIGDEFYWGE